MERKRRKKKREEGKGGAMSADKKYVYGNASEIGQRWSVLF